MLKIIITSFMSVFITSMTHGSLGLEVTFNIATNMPGVEFSGQNKQVIPVKAIISEKEVKDVSIEITPSLLKTGIDKRDEHMHEQVFKNKTITFKSKGCVIKDNKCLLKGSLAMAGNSHEVELPVVFSSGLKKMTFDHNLSLEKHSIKAPSFLGVSVEDTIVIKGKVSAL